MNKKQRSVVLITGSAGAIGSALVAKLKRHYTVIGTDRPGTDCDLEMDITSPQSITAACKKMKKEHGEKLAAVVHLAAYFDFTGEPHPLYENVNVHGTENLIKGLQSFDIERFIYSSTMLVHEPGVVGETIDEQAPLAPRWPYPQSKLDAENMIHRHHGDMPYLILRLAGLYDDQTCVPTLANQIARIFEHDAKSVLYAGDSRAGQSFIHLNDMLALFQAAIAKRNELPDQCELLAGEPETISYQELQNEIGRLIHGSRQWSTLQLPKPLAKAGAWLQEKSEPVVPDQLDYGEKPFIRPFMVDMASDHYALNIGKASELLDWQPKHKVINVLPSIISALKDDPLTWYRQHGITPPSWMETAEELEQNPHELRQQYEKKYRATHKEFLWAHVLNIAMGLWLLTSPMTLGYQSTAMMISDLASGVAMLVLGIFALSPKPILRFSRWALGAVGLWLLFAPLVFWAPTAAAYLNGTIIGTLVIGFALLARPFPGVSPIASETGPEIPPGWNFSPSAWIQRFPIIALAFVGFFISRYLAAYQLGHVDAVWEPFFPGALTDGKNGTEEIITSSVSKAWPVPDAGIGSLTYLLEILTGMIGSNKRWRTMPWLVLLFGFMIVPLGAISITFIIIQPIILNTWCTLCLIAAAAMLLQIPYSFDEIVATLAFLRRRAKLGKPWMQILFTGDTDEGSPVKTDKDIDDIERPGREILKDMVGVGGGVSAPWHLCACLFIGVWLMFTRITLGNDGNMANADHLVGALVVTITVTAFAEVMRSIRFLNIFLGMSLLITPFIFSTSMVSIVSTLLCGLALIGFSLPRGKIENPYGQWSKVIL
ncbi:vitamin K epoxide reductase family protein [Permianibacter aggregans]|uniref:Nucleoside-diphosphate-sugar epimerase n=1 Tax=Permianibacter aggregans TaxID=1510150 RepID=A0A4R6UKR5_9GAMM|nr:vitamin K epoxide reductase family protein [Permianibacter aggregans]QGX41632.1 NAD-dependent epimerase/dehydratase family protein [Permianibacter aggregans]TDQ45705.1 nucleoside-diphosphate-sugar epimerase [Permianibacter aggregans]